MRISLLRSGGLTGMRLEATVETSVLDPDTSSRFVRLVESADLASLSEPTIRVKSDPDHFRYTLTVEDANTRQSITFEEHRIPESIRPLIEAVWSAAGSGPVSQS